MELVSHLIFIFLVYFVFSPDHAQSYNCSTPIEWLNKIKQDQKLLSFGIGGKWPGGVVKYRIMPTLSEQDKQAIFQAFDEYHKKTCIRFLPYSTSDKNYVSIELDNNICGMAHVCMKGGYQFLKFGQNCRSKNNLVHQLGHTLCLVHEEYRQHVDKSISYSKDCEDSGPQTKNPLVSRIYDPASQMHCGCDTGSKCAYQITHGLSLQDADYINALYKCTGCHRHRWISKQSIDLIDDDSLFSFGLADLEGQQIFPCRAFFKNKLGVGKFNKKEGACYVSNLGQEYKLCEQFEVLVIPDGVRESNTEYVLEEAFHGMSIQKERALFKNAVPAGRLSWADGASSYGQGYIAFGTIPNFQKSCQYDTMWWSGGANRKMDVIGTAWRFKNGTHAFAALCELEFPVNIYYVLSCQRRDDSLPNTDDDDSTPSATLPEVIQPNSLQFINVTVIESECFKDEDSLSSQQQCGIQPYLFWMSVFNLVVFGGRWW